MKAVTERRNKGFFVHAHDKVGVVIKMWKPDNQEPRIEFVRYNTRLNELLQAIEVIGIELEKFYVTRHDTPKLPDNFCLHGEQ